MDSEPWTWPIFATVAPGNNSYYSTLVAFYLPVAYNLMSSHVIIGGLGNVGRHMQHLLLRKGKVVRVLDRARPASATAERGLVHPSVEFRPFQLGYDDPVKLRDELKGAEVVYSMVTPDVQHGTVYDFEQTNHLGVQHLIDACRDAGVPKLVYASSIAATNHFIESRNKNEQDPLPPWETYKTLYDRTKRLGEEVVLNAGSEGDGNFKACAIRLGGILAGPTDYYTRHYWEMGEKNGRLISAKGSRIDSISAKDLVRALWKAQEKLDDSETSDLVSGRAFFVTKSSNKVTPETHEIGAHLAKLMDWEIQFLPGYVRHTAFWFVYVALIRSHLLLFLTDPCTRGL